MPDKRTHRGPNPQDAELFTEETIGVLRMACEDFSLLLSKGYADKSSLKIVGDKFNLTKRQRLAVMRSCCSDQQLELRISHKKHVQDLRGKSIAIDGYNLLITIESALGGGIILKGRDGCFRDLASIHGTYRKVDETIPAIMLIADYLGEVEVSKVKWFFDSSVSNSAKLKKLLEKLAIENNWRWQIELSLSPDAELIKSDLIIVSSDSVVLDGCGSWVNLGAEIITQKIPAAKVVDLSKKKPQAFIPAARAKCTLLKIVRVFSSAARRPF